MTLLLTAVSHKWYNWFTEDLSIWSTKKQKQEKVERCGKTKNESGGGGELEIYNGSEKTGERNNKR